MPVSGVLYVKLSLVLTLSLSILLVSTDMKTLLSSFFLSVRFIPALALRAPWCNIDLPLVSFFFEGSFLRFEFDCCFLAVNDNLGYAF